MKNAVYQFYAEKQIEFEGLTSTGTVVKNTHLQPEYMTFKNREFHGDEMKKAAGTVLRSLGWKTMPIHKKKAFAKAFCHQYLLSHDQLTSSSGFCDGGNGFSMFNPFSPIYTAPKVSANWFDDDIEVEGWTCFSSISKKNGFITHYRAYHFIVFNAKGDISKWEIKRFF
eukprot:gene10848-3468_t